MENEAEGGKGEGGQTGAADPPSAEQGEARGGRCRAETVHSASQVKHSVPPESHDVTIATIHANSKSSF